MAVVYQHIRKDTNEIFYIGIGNTKKRAYYTSVRNKHWHNIVSKSSYDVDILIEEISIEIAKEYEQFLISFYGRCDKKLGPLVNMTDGGEYSNPNRGKKLGKRSKETIEKLKNAWTEERKKLHSKKYSGKNSYWYGKNGSAAPMFGKKQSEKHREAIKKYMNSDRNPAKHIEIRKKFSESKMGEKNPRAKKIDQYTIEGHYVKTWNSIADAKRELNIFHIDQVCLGNRKIAGGYIWKYKN